MPRHRRSNASSIRVRQVDPRLTYEGLSSNPLTYIDEDTLPLSHSHASLCLAEFFYEHWDVNVSTEQITLHDPFSFADNDDRDYLKQVTHPLKWLFELVQTEQLLVHHSSKRCTLTLVYPFVSSTNQKSNVNLFTLYTYCKYNDRTNGYFKSLFTFDNYQSISNIDDAGELDAVNIIDFIYREIQAATMATSDRIDDSAQFESLLKNEIIQLKDHQIKSIYWMLSREHTTRPQSVDYTPLHRCHDLSDHPFDIHIIHGIPLDTDEVHRWNDEQLSLAGGILCDEMGLGKTMCVLLTSLLHRCPSSFLSANVSVVIPPSNDDDDDECPPQKRSKVEQPTSLPCICGKVAGMTKRRQNLQENLLSTCTQCARSIHRKCLIQGDEVEPSFLCPYCEQRSADAHVPLSTGATLIVAPASIIDQWIEEIDKHLDCPLNIYMYEGIVNKVPVPHRRFLAKQDFVFCSYENLKKDIHHNEICSQEHHSTRMQQKKYEYLISPLLRLKFWRLVLDEAQMVDSPNTPTSKMARSLLSHHRWFVSGTPFHRSINDLEGIVQYLFPSTTIPRHHIASLLRNKDKIHDVFLSWIMNFLKSISRRTSRQCLNDLPEQYERVMRLQFSQLERTYYDRVWNQCRDEFKREFQHLWQKRERTRNEVSAEQPATWTLESDGDVDMTDVHFLSSAARSCLQTPLVKLRCLCDHPQVGAHGVRHDDPALVHYYNRFHYSTNKRFAFKRPTESLQSNAPLNKDDQPFTMKDLLDLLTARELESGEDSLRLALLNFNGLAGLYLIQYQHDITRPVFDDNNNNSAEHYLDRAIQTYERVIQTGELYKDDFHADSFQLAHAYYNLSYSMSLVAKTDSGVPDASHMSADEASEKFNKIKERYQTQSVSEMNEAWKNYNESLLTRREVENDVKNLLIDMSTCIKPIENEKIDIHSHVNRERQLPFTNWKGFLLTLIQQFDKLKQIREHLLIDIEALERQPTDSAVTKMGMCSRCGLDPDGSDDNVCIFCECDTVMKSYNCSLQPELYSDKQINDDGGAHLVYYINEILSKASMRSNESTRQLGKLLRTDWNDLLKKLRLENTSARTYSQQLKHLYQSLDEMLQCTSRLEFYTGDLRHRPKNRFNRYRFNPDIIDEERVDFEQQASDHLQKVLKHRQQFHYFQEQQQDYYRSIATSTNLGSAQRAKCPMCHELFGEDRPDVCFFLCGHFFCSECTQHWKTHEMTQRPHRPHLKCPICRREIPINSLTVLKWQNQNAPTGSSSHEPSGETPLVHSLSSPRHRRLMETQEHLTIQGRYGTKVDSIVSFILTLLSEDVSSSTNALAATTTTTTMMTEKPPPKILVFSQFTDILNVLAISLKLNAISYLQFTSTKILQQFRQDPNITVLLMPLGKGANGLNLTEAQHVILVEPQLHRSVELQAIARVRRLGQRYNTYVYRFIIDDTAEEVVLANSRTAQTVTHQPTSASSESTSIPAASRAASFADFELLYEINMARKIFFKPSSSAVAHHSDLFLV